MVVGIAASHAVSAAAVRDRRPPAAFEHRFHRAHRRGLLGRLEFPYPRARRPARHHGANWSRKTTVYRIYVSAGRRGSFTFSVPVYWAIVLAAPLGRSGVRALILGTALVFIIEVLSLLAQAEMIAYAAAAQLHLGSNGLASWSRDLGTRLVVGVIPFAAPVLAAVALHRDLKARIFSPQAVPGHKRAWSKRRAVP